MNTSHLKQHVLVMVLFIITKGFCFAQCETKVFDSIRISMHTPFDAGVMWNCSCVLHNDTTSICIREFYRSVENPQMGIVLPQKKVIQHFVLTHEQDVFFEDYKPLYNTLSNLAFDIIGKADSIRLKREEEIDSDTTWVVSIYRDGKTVGYFSIGNDCQSSTLLRQLSGIMEGIVILGHVYPNDSSRFHKYKWQSMNGF